MNFDPDSLFPVKNALYARLCEKFGYALYFTAKGNPPGRGYVAAEWSEYPALARNPMLNLAVYAPPNGERARAMRDAVLERTGYSPEEAKPEPRPSAADTPLKFTAHITLEIKADTQAGAQAKIQAVLKALGTEL